MPQDYGRKTKLNPRIAQALIGSIANGAYIQTACDYVGVHKTTFYYWRGRGQAEMERYGEGAEDVVSDAAVTGDKATPIPEMFAKVPDGFDPEEWPFVVFLNQTERAKATAELRNLTIIQQAAGQSWQAAAWILERTHADRYAQRTRMNMEGPQDGSPMEVRMITATELEAKIEQLRQENGG